MDFVKPAKPDISQRGLVLSGRIATIVALVVAVIWAPIIAEFDTLYEYLQSVLSYLVPPVVVVFLLGIGWKRVNAPAAFFTLVVMQPLGFIAFLLIEVRGMIELQFLYAAGILTGLSLLMMLVISILGPTPDLEKTDELTWKNHYWTDETAELKTTPWWANYRLITVVMLLATAGLVVAFA
jgi:solute:Na+ symporter, SSS family